MKPVFVIVFIFLLAACSNTTEKTKTAEDSAIEKEVLVVDSALVENSDSTVKEKIVTEEPDDEDVLEIIFEYKKSPCFGNCPVFTVQLFSNGRIIYDGKFHVEKKGLFESNVNDSFIYTIFQEAEKIGFFEMSKTYPEDGTVIADLPKTVTYLKKGEKEHKVINSFAAPKDLLNFEQYLNEKIDSLYWTKVEN